MALGDDEDEWEEKIRNSLRYSIRLLIKHPNIDPADITGTLRMTPRYAGIAGSRRTTSAGRALLSVRDVSEWTHTFDVKRNRLFFQDVVKMIDRLEPHRDFLHKIVSDGGSINLIVSLPGDINIGDTFSWREIARLSALRINLDIEVFPDFR